MTEVLDAGFDHVPGIERNRAGSPVSSCRVDGVRRRVRLGQAAPVDLTTGQITGSVAFEANSTPYQVRLAKDGRALRRAEGAAQVAEVDPATLKITRTIATGRHPNDLLVSGDRLFVSCGNDDVVDIFDRYTGTREERVNVRPWPDAPPGSTPHALAISPDSERLYVALSDNNAVAVLDVGIAR